MKGTSVSSASVGEVAPRAGGLVDGRYSLMTLLGRGGMGEVWYAWDAQGERPVALKFVRGKDGAPPSPSVRARQLREARAAQRVRHPRVVELYGVVDDASYGHVLVMEYLEGESLASKLARDGALPLGEAAGLAIDLCEGLAAAHAVGVVHRDLKPSNVLMVPTEKGSRPCLIDFGVAKLLTVTGDGASSTAGGFAGTPMYMAPEQLFGEGDVDYRADVWSLGLMLFEVLTGLAPTAGEHFGEVLKKVIERPMPRAQTIAPALPAALDGVLARMLTRERGVRPALSEIAQAFASFAGREVHALPAPKLTPSGAASEAKVEAAGPAGEPVTTLDGPEALRAGASGSMRSPSAPRPGESGFASATGEPERPSTQSRPGAWWRRGGVGAKLAAAVLALGVLGIGVRHRAALTGLASSRADTRRVHSFAVLTPGDDLSPEAGSAQSLGRALAFGWAMSTEARVVSPESAARVERARAFGAGGPVDAGAARAVAEALGVDALVVVRVVPSAEAKGGALARVEFYAPADDWRGEGALTLSPGASDAELFGVTRRASERFGLRDREVGERGLAALGLPGSPGPLAHTLLAQRALRRGDLAAARRELGAEGVAANDAPALRLARAQLKAAEGDDRGAQALATEALAAAGGLAREERLALEAEAQALAFDFGKAVDTQRALWTLRPEVLEHGLRLADLLVSASRAADAREVLAEIVARQPSDDGGRIGVSLGQALFLAGERERAIAEFEPAIGRAERAGDIEAAARGSMALARNGDPSVGREYAERARSLYQSVGDAVGAVRAEVALASVAMRSQHPEEAAEALARARRRAPAGGETYAEAQALNLEAWFARNRGEARRAQDLAVDGLAAARATGNKVLIVYALNTSGVNSLEHDDFEQANVLFREAVAVSKAMGDKHRAAVFQQNLALCHLQRGEIHRAREVIEEAVAQHREERDRYHIAWALDTLGLVELASARTAEAHALFDEALALRESNGLVGSPSRQNLADALRSEGRLADAVATGQRAVDELHERGLVNEEISALVLLADLLVDAGETAKARAAAERALSLAEPSKRPVIRTYLMPTLAQIEFAEGDRGAIERLEQALRPGALSEVQRLWGRLTLGQLLVRSGQRARGQALLGTLIADARSSGQRELARQAERFLNPTR